MPISSPKKATVSFFTILAVAICKFDAVARTLGIDLLSSGSMLIDSKGRRGISSVIVKDHLFEVSLQELIPSAKRNIRNST